ncbi:MAG: hypothetical protein ISS36_03240 [Candidatus Aenigmarchaeota archaeon]|nr:hypothetical protein [Candidatus Aenigmarchaeota archaeon]
MFTFALAQADILNSVLDFAITQSATGWINLGVNLIISTIIGGLVLILLMKVVEYEWGESFNPANAFFVVLIINAISIFGIVKYLVPIIPAGGLILPVVIWIALIKAFFSGLTWKHVLVVAIVGWIISIFLIPYLVGIIKGFIPAII